MISLNTYNKEKLGELIRSDQFFSFSFKPITIHRAISHINNPRAAKDDTLLILAFDDDKLAGYIGVLPDYIFHKEQKIKVGWLSTLFVHPDFRGKKIAQLLLAKACEQYQDKILITEFTPEAERMYIKSNCFEYLEPLKGYIYHYRFNLMKILPHKNTIWKKYSAVLEVIDNIANLFFKPILRTPSFKKESFRIANRLDEESIAFIKENTKTDTFNRNPEEIEWITDYPWVLTGNHAHRENYIFSSFSRSFEYIFIKIYNKNSLGNLIILTVRDKQAKLQYKYGNYDDELCTRILHQYVIKNKITSLICYDEGINFFLRKQLLPYKKIKVRKYLINKELRSLLGNDFNFIISGGDADCVFT